MAAFCTVFVGVWVGIRGWLAFETVLLDFGVWVGFGGWHAFCVFFFRLWVCGLGFGLGGWHAFYLVFVAVWDWGLFVGWSLLLWFCWNLGFGWASVHVCVLELVWDLGFGLIVDAHFA